MSHRATGATFCVIAAVLFASRYIAAAVYGSNTTTWNSSLFDQLLVYVGSELRILSIISLVIGAIYLVVAEVISVRRAKQDDQGH